MEFVAVAGDWHANMRWAVTHIPRICDRLRELGEDKPLILHAGDYGHWNDATGVLFRQMVTSALKRNGAELWFVDGNHEDHEDLLNRSILLGKDRLSLVPITDQVSWLPRGYRWYWSGRTWLALGGAASIDKDLRTPGFDWFSEETINLRQAALACAPGHADVMLTHDAPSWVPLRMSLPSSMFAPDVVKSCDEHRELMARIMDETKPSHLIHGHYHVGAPAWKDVAAPYGAVKVCSLPEDGNQNNWGILNVRTMEWADK